MSVTGLNTKGNSRQYIRDLPFYGHVSNVTVREAATGRVLYKTDPAGKPLPGYELLYAIHHSVKG